MVSKEESWETQELILNLINDQNEALIPELKRMLKWNPRPATTLKEWVKNNPPEGMSATDLAKVNYTQVVASIRAEKRDK